MIVKTSTLVSRYKTLTRDNSSDNETNGKDLLNYYYEMLLSEANNYVVEMSRYANLKGNQSSYLLPKNYQKMNTIRVKSGDRWYPTEEIKSLTRWHEAIAVPHSSNIPYAWIIINEEGNIHIELYPTPSDDVANGLELVFDGYQDPLYFPTDYNSGSVTIAQGASSVVGAGTTFTSSMIGRFLQVSGGKYWYELKTFTDSSNIELVDYFQETSVTASSFTIAELPRLPQEFHFTPLWGAVADYYAPNNKAKHDLYEAKFIRDLTRLQSKYKSKSKGAITPGVRVGHRLSPVPRNYPTSALTRI